MIEYRPNLAAKANVKDRVFAAVEETFELDIKPLAVATSPVTPDGLAKNLEMGKKGVKAYGTGHNRQSIDVEVKMTSEGPAAELFTQSGYGGWLEIGTSLMRAQPYLWPAFEQMLDRLKQKVKRSLRG